MANNAFIVAKPYGFASATLSLSRILFVQHHFSPVSFFLLTGSLVAPKCMGIEKRNDISRTTGS